MFIRVLALIVAACIFAIAFVARNYIALCGPFRDGDNRKLFSFVVLTATQLVLAIWTLINEDAVRHWRTADHAFSGGYTPGQFPGILSPVDHVASLERVGFFGICSFLSLLVVWLFVKQDLRTSFLPPTRAILLPAVGAMLLSSLLFHYAWRIDCCCQPPQSAFFFGFPFSFIQSTGDHENSMQDYIRNGLPDILRLSKAQLAWRIRFFPFILDAIFWLNTSFIAQTIGRLPIRSKKRPIIFSKISPHQTG